MFAGYSLTLFAARVYSTDWHAPLSHAHNDALQAGSRAQAEQVATTTVVVASLILGKRRGVVNIAMSGVSASPSVSY